MTSPTVRPYVLMLLGSVAFAVMASLGHALGARCPWQVIALARSSLVFFLGVGLALGYGVRLVVWRPASLWARSLAGSCSLVCSFYALTRLPTAEVLTLGSTFAIWIAVLSWPLEGRPPGAGVWLAALCGVAGVALIQQPRFDAAGSVTALALFAALCSAVAMLGLNRTRGVDHLAVVVHFSGVASLVCVAALLGTDGDWKEAALDGATPWMLAGVGVSATLGQICLTKAYVTGPPTKVSVVSLSQIAFALVLDVAFWGETVNAAKLAGIALVAAPSAWLMTGRAATPATEAAEADPEVLAPGD